MTKIFFLLAIIIYLAQSLNFRSFRQRQHQSKLFQNSRQHTRLNKRKYNTPDGLNECEFVVSGRAVDLTPLTGQTIMIDEESPNNQYFLKYTPCQNAVRETCYENGQQPTMAAQLNGNNDGYGQGILAIWNNKTIQPSYSQTNDGKDKFTFQYPNINSCAEGCANGRSLEVNYICDMSGNPYDPSQSNFYENPACVYHVNIYSKYACPISVPPTKTPTQPPTTNATCNGGICVSPIIINENGNKMVRYVVSTSPDMVKVNNNNQIIIQHNAQVQIAKVPATAYSPNIFMEYKLSGKTLSYTVDLSRISCSCNSALYLVTMPGYGSNGQPDAGQYGNYYCDANDVGGVWCWELDIQEANMYVTATTPHNCNGPPGRYISSCDRGGCGTNSHNVNGGAMCPGGCIINTQQPFKYSISFSNNDYHVTLSQNGKTFSYDACGNSGYLQSMEQALDYGMVIVMSYWGDTYSTMQWLDGNTGCGGDCDTSGQAVFSDFQIS